MPFPLLSPFSITLFNKYYYCIINQSFTFIALVKSTFYLWDTFDQKRQRHSMNIARERCCWSVDVHVGINLKHKEKIVDIWRISQVLINNLKYIQ